MNLLTATLIILHKDLRAEWRTKERLSPMIFFVLLVLLMFNFSFELGDIPLYQVAPGVLWSAFIFSSLLGLNRSFVDERENSCLDALLSMPGSRTAIYLAKMVGNLIFLLMVQLIGLPVFILFFNLSPGLPMVRLLGIFILGSANLATIGTLFASMSSNMRLRELLLPLLVLPLAMPALIASVKSTSLILQHRSFETIFPYLQILVVYWVVFTTLALLLFAHIIEE